MNRTDVLNHLAQTFNLKTYLEIGVRNPADNFDRVKCERKIGVDPACSGKYLLSVPSEEAFTAFAEQGQLFDLIFIDADHRFAGVALDLTNALQCVTPGGWIVMHDCNPQTQEAVAEEKPNTGRAWNGQAWEVWAWTAGLSVTYRACVDIDHGCGVLRAVRAMTYGDARPMRRQWAGLAANRKTLLNLVTWQEFLSQTTPSVLGVGVGRGMQGGNLRGGELAIKTGETHERTHQS